MALENGFTAVKWTIRLVHWFILAFVAVVIVGSALFFLWAVLAFRSMPASSWGAPA
jgi:hypothetical protein